MRNAIAGCLLRGLLLLLVASPTALAQTAATAQINGAIKDQAGLSLPGVTVTSTRRCRRSTMETSGESRLRAIHGSCSLR